MKGEPTDPLHLTRLSQVTIEPFYKDNLNNANIPPELNEDETGLIKRKIDLPIMLLRCKDKPGAVWTLRLPEFNFLGSKEAEGYQVKYHWKQQGPTAYYYDWHPITGPMQGRVNARVWVDQDGRVRFEIQQINDSKETWEMPAVWVCLIHKYSGDGRSTYWSQKGPEPTSSIPAPQELWLKWFPVKGKEEFVQACRQWRSKKIRSGLAVHPQLVWKPQEPDGFSVRIGSDQAGLLGWSHWPCTDLGLTCDETGPGETTKFTGYVEMGWEE